MVKPEHEYNPTFEDCAETLGRIASALENIAENLTPCAKRIERAIDETPPGYRIAPDDE